MSWPHLKLKIVRPLSNTNKKTFDTAEKGGKKKKKRKPRKMTNNLFDLQDSKKDIKY